MSDPSAALQVAIAAALLADATVAGVVADRVLDPIAAQDADYPLIEVGQSQWVPDNGTCFDSGLSYETLHLWASGVQARLVTKALTSAVAAVLAPGPAGTQLAPDGARVVSAILHDVHHQDDTDRTEGGGMIAHSTVVFCFRVQATA